MSVLTQLELLAKTKQTGGGEAEMSDDRSHSAEVTWTLIIFAEAFIRSSVIINPEGHKIQNNLN